MSVSEGFLPENIADFAVRLEEMIRIRRFWKMEGCRQRTYLCQQRFLLIRIQSLLFPLQRCLPADRDAGAADDAAVPIIPDEPAVPVVPDGPAVPVVPDGPAVPIVPDEPAVPIVSGRAGCTGCAG